MTHVELACAEDGALLECRAWGHAGFAIRGQDIVCAAETHLLRTAIAVLRASDGVEVDVDAPRRGVLVFRVVCGGQEWSAVRGRLKCVADFIREGIKGLAEEYPRYVRLHEVSK